MMNKKMILIGATSVIGVILIAFITVVAIANFSQIKETEPTPTDEATNQGVNEPQELPAAKALKEQAEQASAKAEYTKAKELYTQAQKLYEENSDTGRATEMQLQADIATQLEGSQDLINRDPPLQQTGQ